MVTQAGPGHRYASENTISRSLCRADVFCVQTTFEMNKMPKIDFGLAGLYNWEEINQWAMCNDVLWRGTHMHSRALMWSEIDTLRILCAELLSVKVKSENS